MALLPTSARPKPPGGKLSGTGRGKPGGPKPGGLRIAGFPWYVVAGGVVLAIALGLMLRNRGGAASAAAAPALVSSGADEGEQGGGGVAASDIWELTDALDGLSGILGAGGFSTSPSGAVAQASGTGASEATAPSFETNSAGLPVDKYGYVTYESLGVPTGYPGGEIRSDHLAPPTAEQQRQSDIKSVRSAAPAATIPQATNQQPFGGVVKSEKLPNGSVLTTFRSGRQVQQAAGKSAYVVKKGGKK